MGYSVDIDGIRNWVKSNISEKRYLHTLGVEKEARKIAEVFMPDKADKLAVAALLHDITKENGSESHMNFCEKLGIELPAGIKNSPKLFHAITGAYFARAVYGEAVVDDEVFAAIYYHTTGRRGMSLAEMILYLADYIEETRTFDDCVKLREYFYTGMTRVTNMEEAYMLLLKTLELSFDMTVKALIDEGSFVDTCTVDARNYIIEQIRSRQ